MKIYLVRHGQTDWNREGRIQGQTDIPLNRTGIAMAEAAAKGLKQVPFQAAFSSPLKRARQTAQIILGSRPIALRTDRRLEEISFGRCEGEWMEQIKADPSSEMYCFFCQPEAYLPPAGGESFPQLYARAAEFVNQVLVPAENQWEDVLVVGHATVNRAIINPAAGIPLSDFRRVFLGNCAVSVLELKKGKLRLLEAGRTYPLNEASAETT